MVATLGEVRFVLFADSPTHFFAKTTDVQLEFHTKEGKTEGVTWSVGEGANQAKKIR